MTPEETNELIKMARRVLPNQIAKEICSVQPMGDSGFKEFYEYLQTLPPGYSLVFTSGKANNDISS